MVALHFPPRKALALLAIVPILTGCSRPIDVHVIDQTSGAHVPGARVRRMDIRKPYFIVGRIYAAETRRTNAAGVARLRSRVGHLRVDAEGYEEDGAELDTKADSVVVPLKPAERRGEIEPATD